MALPLVSTDERIEVVISIDPDIVLRKRKPVKCIKKSDAKINGGCPTVFILRPLRAREIMRLIETVQISTAEATYTACELAITEIVSEKGVVDKSSDISDYLDRLPLGVAGAISDFIYDHSTSPKDPT